MATYPELRAAFNAAQPEVSAFYSGIPLEGGLWRNIKAYAAGEEAAQLTAASAMVSIEPLKMNDGPPQHFLVAFRCRGLVKVGNEVAG